MLSRTCSRHATTEVPFRAERSHSSPIRSAVGSRMPGPRLAWGRPRLSCATHEWRIRPDTRGGSCHQPFTKAVAWGDRSGVFKTFNPREMASRRSPHSFRCRCGTTSLRHAERGPQRPGVPLCGGARFVGRLASGAGASQASGGAAGGSTQDEVHQLLSELRGTMWMMASLMDGSGLG